MIYSRKLPSQYGSASVLGIAMGLIGFVALGKVTWESPLPPDVPAWALTGRFDSVAVLSVALAAGLT